MWATEGFKGLFKGNGMTVLKIAPFSAFEFYFYELYRHKLYPGKSKSEISFGGKLLCGAFTGMTA